MSDTMFSDRIAYLDAILPESNGVYEIELKTPAGLHLKTIKGCTTNGIVQADWDLVDEKNLKYTGDSFNGWFHITLPDSGRSNVLEQAFGKMP